MLNWFVVIYEVANPRMAHGQLYLLRALNSQQDLANICLLFFISKKFFFTINAKKLSSLNKKWSKINYSPFSVQFVKCQ